MPDAPTLKDLYAELELTRKMIPAIWSNDDGQFDTPALRSAIATACAAIREACEATNPGLPAVIEAQAAAEWWRNASVWERLAAKRRSNG